MRRRRQGDAAGAGVIFEHFDDALGAKSSQSKT
jgi:hypothetical protein